MKPILLLALLMLAACATQVPPEPAREAASGPTIYGQLSTSVDHISVN